MHIDIHIRHSVSDPASLVEFAERLRDLMGGMMSPRVEPAGDAAPMILSKPGAIIVHDGPVAPTLPEADQPRPKRGRPPAAKTAEAPAPAPVIAAPAPVKTAEAPAPAPAPVIAAPAPVIAAPAPVIAAPAPVIAAPAPKPSGKTCIPAVLSDDFDVRRRELAVAFIGLYGKGGEVKLTELAQAHGYKRFSEVPEADHAKFCGILIAEIQRIEAAAADPLAGA